MVQAAADVETAYTSKVGSAFCAYQGAVVNKLSTMSRGAQVLPLDALAEAELVGCSVTFGFGGAVVAIFAAVGDGSVVAIGTCFS